MSDRLEVDVTPTERAAIVTRELMQGKVLTPADVAELTECTLRGGYYVLERLSRVLPIYEEQGRWSMVDSLNFNIEPP